MIPACYPVLENLGYKRIVECGLIAKYDKLALYYKIKATNQEIWLKRDNIGEITKQADKEIARGETLNHIRAQNL